MAAHCIWFVSLIRAQESTRMDIAYLFHESCVIWCVLLTYFKGIVLHKFEKFGVFLALLGALLVL